MKKISSKIMLAITVPCLIIAIFFTTITLVKGKKILEDKAKNKLFNLINSKKHKLEKKISRTEQLAINIEGLVESTINLENLKDDPSNMENYKSNLKDLVITLIKKSKNRSGWIIFDSEVFNKGHTLTFFDKDMDGVLERQPEYDIRKLDFSEGQNSWWSEAKKNGTNWTNPYYWQDWNASIMSYSRAVYVDGQFIGVCGSDFVFSNFKEDLSQQKIFKTGFLTLMDKNMNVIIHPELEGKSLKNITDNEGIKPLKNYLQAHKSYDKIKKIKYKETNHIVASSLLSNNWILTTIVPENEVFSEIARFRISIAIILFITLIIAAFISFLVGKKMSVPIRNSSKILTEIAKGAGDLTIRLDVDSKDEIGEMSIQMNKFLDHMQNMIREITRLNKTLVNSGRLLSTNSKVLNNTTLKIRNEIKSISTTELKEKINQIIEAINQFSIPTNKNSQNKIQNIINELKTINTEIDSTSKNLKNTLLLTEESIVNSKEVNSLSEKIDALTERLNQLIGKFKV